MSTARAIVFVILVDLVVFAHAHKRHGDSCGAADLVKTRMKMLETSFPTVSVTSESLREQPRASLFC